MILLIGFMIGCKKDYPDDIPDWLRKDIKERKKEENGCSLCMTIYELEDTVSAELFYFYYLSGSGDDDGPLHDFEGNQVCIYDLYTGCAAIEFADWNGNWRIIWTEE